MKSVICLRCNIQMNYIAREKLQLGQTGWLLGDLPNLLAGAMEIDIYTCPGCGKIEFFMPEDSIQTDKIAQRKCPKCGHMHDYDYPKCPFCNHNYYND